MAGVLCGKVHTPAISCDHQQMKAGGLRASCDAVGGDKLGWEVTMRSERWQVAARGDRLSMEATCCMGGDSGK